MNRHHLPILLALLAAAPAAHAQSTAGSDYTINYDEATTHQRGSARYTQTVTLVSADGSQSAVVDQLTANRLYIKNLDNCFLASPGEKVTAGFTGSMSWMAGYAYIDLGQDGRFDVDYDENGVNTMQDLMSYSLYKEQDSDGNAVNTSKNSPSTNPPAFTIPADTKPGIYRMRYKIDWDCVDPGGSTATGNTITANGGVIVDTRINIHAATVRVSRTDDGMGQILLPDGTGLSQATVPFGEDLSIRVVAPEGQRLSYLLIKHGYLDGDSLVHGNAQWRTDVVSRLAFTDGAYTIPGSMIDGDVDITPVFNDDSGSDAPLPEYGLRFDKTLPMGDPTANVLSSLTLSTAAGETSTLAVGNAAARTVYRDLTPAEAHVKAGDTVTPTVAYEGNAAINAYLYLDINRDGRFEADLNSDGSVTAASELLSYSYAGGRNSKGEAVTADEAGHVLPPFTLPAGLKDGIYRMRLKLDVDDTDPSGRTPGSEAAGLDANGGVIADFLLNVHGATVALEANGVGGHLVGASNSGIPSTVAFGSDYTVLPLAPADGYTLSSLTVRHGYGLDGPQYVHGNRQWSEYQTTSAMAGTSYTVPADSVNGDLRITAQFAASGSEEYKLVFSDEFSGEDGSLPNPDVWSNCSRENPTWKRFTSQTPEGQARTAFLRDGKLVTRCFANDIADEGSVEMISGAIESAGKVYLTYGRVEGRLKTTPHTGNFPAFWMMPEDNSAGWPNAGEIDIWEQIDTENRTYHTVHTHCTYDLHLALPNSGNTSARADEYHVIALEWTPTLLTWYVDGKKAFTYSKSSLSTLLNQGQWPYDKPFYIILNQSVGNGTWAQPCDVSFDYETLFDYVRVYQKEGQEIYTGITDVRPSADTDFQVVKGGITLVSGSPSLMAVYDLQGRRVFSDTVSGRRMVSLRPGVYVLGGKKVLVP